MINAVIKKYLYEYQKEFNDSANKLKYDEIIEGTGSGIIYLSYRDIDKDELFNIKKFCEIYKFNYHITNSHNYLYVSIF